MNFAEDFYILSGVKIKEFPKLWCSAEPNRANNVSGKEVMSMIDTLPLGASVNGYGTSIKNSIPCCSAKPGASRASAGAKEVFFSFLRQAERDRSRPTNGAVSGSARDYRAVLPVSSKFHGVDCETLDNERFMIIKEKNKSIRNKIHRSEARLIFINIFKANNKTMFPVWQIKSCQILAKNKSVMSESVAVGIQNWLHAGGFPIGRIGNPVLAFPDTPSVTESGKPEIQNKERCLIMKLTLILIMSFSIFPLAVQSQEKSAQGRVVLEEEEVTLFNENGKEIEKRHVSKWGTEKAAIRRQVRDKVLKSMGIKSQDKMKGDKKLYQRYLKEHTRFIKVKELKPRTLKFVDNNEKVIKEVPICPPGSGCNHNITTMPMEYWQSMEIKTTADEVMKRKVEQRITREPTVAKSQKAAVISEINSEFSVPISTQEAFLADRGGGELGTESSIEYYDGQGNMRWKKKSEKRNLLLYPGGLSENGEMIAVIKRCEYGCRKLADEGILLQQIEVYDSNGEAVLTLPLTKEFCFSYGAGFWLSLDGNFFKFDCQPEKGWPKSILINIKERKFWKATDLIGIARGDDGYEIREGSKLRVAVTGDNELGSKSAEIDLEKLSWQKLP